MKLIKIMRNKDDPPMEGITLEEEKKLAQLVFFHAGIKHISTFDLDPFCPPVLSGCVFGPEFLQLSTPEAIFMQPRSPPHDMLEEAMKQSREMIDSGQIVMGASSYNSNILMVPKPQLRGQTKPSLRLVIDYRALNSRTIKLNWPLLPTMEALDYMCGYSNYSASDCASGYHQIKVCPSIARCLAYSVGTWRLIPLKMPMGATNSMNCFMYCLSRAIGHLAQGCCELHKRNIKIRRPHPRGGVKNNYTQIFQLRALGPARPHAFPTHPPRRACPTKTQKIRKKRMIRRLSQTKKNV